MDRCSSIAAEICDGDHMNIDLAPKTTAAEIEQNVQAITSIMRGTQPLDRSLGLDPELVDMPGKRGMALLQAEIIDKLPQQEPRITVKKVAFDESDVITGQYKSAITYEVTDE